MPYLDPVERWIVQTTGRTLDQHAADPVPAAAHLPASADELRLAREHLLFAVDKLRMELINADDLSRSVDALTGALKNITSHVSEYAIARVHIDQLIDDPDRTAYASTNPVQPVWRRYINPGDTVLIVLPHTEVCRRRGIAGRTVRAQIDESDAELDPVAYPGPVRLLHAAAGIYRDPVDSRLYVLHAASERSGSGISPVTRRRGSMPIQITTPRQRAAVAAAAQAANIIRNRLRDAALIELARHDSPLDGVITYQLLNIWSRGGWFVPSAARCLWSAAPDHDGHRLLRSDEVRQIEAFLETAGDTEPYLFEPGEPGSGRWQLNINSVFRAFHDDAAKQ